MLSLISIILTILISARERERERKVTRVHTQNPPGCVILDSFIKSERLNCCVLTSFAACRLCRIVEVRCQLTPMHTQKIKGGSPLMRPLGFAVK